MLNLKKLTVLFFACLAINTGINANQYNDCCQPCEPVCNGRAYFKLSSGASFANKAHIHADPSLWDPALQGYNSDLGTRAIAGAGVGYEFNSLLSTDVTYTYRGDFNYKKFQTPTTNTTPGALGEKTRRFKLDVASLMFNFNLSGRDYDFCCWQNEWVSGSLYPILGVGLGVNKYTIHDFRSTGLPVLVPPTASFGSDNAYKDCYRFAYQVMAGLEYRFTDSWAFSVGYRWLDSGKVTGPKYVRDSEGDTLDVSSAPWKIKFVTQEAFVELKYFL